MTNRSNPQARSLTYCEFPTEWSWDTSSRSWSQRKRGRKIGRIYYVHPSSGELYYLRMLLMIVKGATCYADIRTYNSTIFETFKQACAARGLLGDDIEWYHAFDESLCSATCSQLRHLFVTILLFCHVKNERKFFDKYWKDLAEDLQYRTRVALQNPDYVVSTTILQNMLLTELELIFNRNGANISNYDIPTKTHIQQNKFMKTDSFKKRYHMMQFRWSIQNLLY